MLRMAKTFSSFMIAACLLAGTAFAQGGASEHEAHAAKAQEGAKMMMDGCEMMKSDAEKGGMMMGDGHAKMMEAMKADKKMDPAKKAQMMAADKMMMKGKKMMMDGMKMMMQGKEMMAKTQQAQPGHETGKHEAKKP